jgi:non-specific serine/threonine protein kinase
VHDDQAELAACLYVRAALLLLSPDFPLALPILAECLRHFDEAGLVDSDAICARAVLSMVTTRTGDYEEAARIAGEALAISVECEESWARSYALFALALACYHHGDLARATEAAKSCLLIKEAFDDVLGLALGIELLAWTSAKAGDHRRTAVLLGVAKGKWATIGGEPLMGSAVWIAPHDESTSIARQALGDATFETHLQRGATMEAAKAMAFAMDEKPAKQTPRGTLSAREIEVATLVARGLTNAQIATSLMVSSRTVESHIRHTLTKLQLTSRAQIARWIALHADAQSR